MKYRKVSVKIWNDAGFRSLPDDSRLVFLFLLTHPNMTAAGAMKGSIPGLAAELRLNGKPDPEPFRKAFKRVCKTLSVRFDEEAGLIVFPKFLQHNPPENKNVAKHIGRCLRELPECAELTAQYDRIRAAMKNGESLLEGFTQGFMEGYTEGFNIPNTKPNRTQEQEPEQEPEQEQETDKDQEGNHKNGFLPGACEDATPEPHESAPLHPLQFPTAAKGGIWQAPQAKIAEWGDTYSTIDLEGELRLACQWLRDNPGRRKTARGMPKFLGSWLTRATNGRHGKKGQPIASEVYQHATGAEDDIKF